MQPLLSIGADQRFRTFLPEDFFAVFFIEALLGEVFRVALLAAFFFVAAAFFFEDFFLGEDFFLLEDFFFADFLAVFFFRLPPPKAASQFSANFGVEPTRVVLISIESP